MTLLKVNNRGAAELKAERERDKNQAMAHNTVNGTNVIANSAMLRT